MVKTEIQKLKSEAMKLTSMLKLQNIEIIHQLKQEEENIIFMQNCVQNLQNYNSSLRKIRKSNFRLEREISVESMRSKNERRKNNLKNKSLSMMKLANANKQKRNKLGLTKSSFKRVKTKKTQSFGVENLNFQSMIQKVPDILTRRISNPISENDNNEKINFNRRISNPTKLTDKEEITIDYDSFRENSERKHKKTINNLKNTIERVRNLRIKSRSRKVSRNKDNEKKTKKMGILEKRLEEKSRQEENFQPMGYEPISCESYEYSVETLTINNDKKNQDKKEDVKMTKNNSERVMIDIQSMESKNLKIDLSNVSFSEDVDERRRLFEKVWEEQMKKRLGKNS